MLQNKFISVIIPVYNDLRVVECVRSIFECAYPRDAFEIIVVDNNSTINIKEALSGCAVQVLRENIAGSSAARNAGIAAAKGEILAFVDSDCVVDRDWLDGINAFFSVPGRWAVLGRTKNKAKGWLPSYVQLNMDRGYLVNFKPDVNGDRVGRVCNTRNFSILKLVQERVGLFNLEMKRLQDHEYGLRMETKGIRVFFDPKIIVYHDNTSDLSLYIKKSVSFGFYRKRMKNVRRLHFPYNLGNSFKDFPFVKMFVASMIKLAKTLLDMLDGRFFVLSYYLFFLLEKISIFYGTLLNDDEYHGAFEVVNRKI